MLDSVQLYKKKYDKDTKDKTLIRQKPIHEVGLNPTVALLQGASALQYREQIVN